eukprot:PhM_4_TR7586/c0_g2_i1/m.68675
MHSSSNRHALSSNQHNNNTTQNNNSNNNNSHKINNFHLSFIPGNGHIGGALGGGNNNANNNGNNTGISNNNNNNNNSTSTQQQQDDMIPGEVRVIIHDSPHCVLGGLLPFAADRAANAHHHHHHRNSTAGVSSSGRSTQNAVASATASSTSGVASSSPNFTLSASSAHLHAKAPVRASYTAYHVVVAFDVSAAMYTLGNDAAGTVPIDDAWDTFVRLVYGLHTIAVPVFLSVICGNGNNMPLDVIAHSISLPTCGEDTESVRSMLDMLRTKFVEVEPSHTTDSFKQRASILGPLLESAFSFVSSSRRTEAYHAPIVVALGNVNSNTLGSCTNTLQVTAHRLHAHTVVLTHCALPPRPAALWHFIDGVGGVLQRMDSALDLPLSDLTRLVTTRLLPTVVRLGDIPVLPHMNTTNTMTTTTSDTSAPSVLYKINTTANMAHRRMIVATVAQESARLGWRVHIVHSHTACWGTWDQYTHAGSIRCLFVLETEQDGAGRLALRHTVYLQNAPKIFSRLDSVFVEDAPRPPPEAHGELCVLQDLRLRDTVLYKMLASLSGVETVVTASVRKILQHVVEPFAKANSNASGYSDVWQNLFDVNSYSGTLTVDRNFPVEDFEASRYSTAMQFPEFSRVLSTQLGQWVGPCGTRESCVYGKFQPTVGGLGGIAILQLLSPNTDTPRPVYTIEIRVSTVALCGAARVELTAPWEDVITRREMSLGCGRRTFLPLPGVVPIVVERITAESTLTTPFVPITDVPMMSECEVTLQRRRAKGCNRKVLSHPLVPNTIDQYFHTVLWSWNISHVGLSSAATTATATPTQGPHLSPLLHMSSSGSVFIDTRTQLIASLVRQRLCDGFTLLQYEVHGAELPRTRAIFFKHLDHHVVYHTLFEEAPLEFTVTVRILSEVARQCLRVLEKQRDDILHQTYESDARIFSMHYTYNTIRGLRAQANGDSTNIVEVKHSPHWPSPDPRSFYVARGQDEVLVPEEAPLWIPSLHAEYPIVPHDFPDSTFASTNEPASPLMPPVLASTATPATDIPTVDSSLNTSFGVLPASSNGQSGLKQMLQLWCHVTVTDVSSVEPYQTMGVDSMYVHVGDDDNLIIAMTATSRPNRVYFVEVPQSVLSRNFVRRIPSRASDLDTAESPRTIGLTDQIDALRSLYTAQRAMNMLASFRQGKAELTMATLTASTGVLEEYVDIVEATDCIRVMHHATLAELHSALKKDVLHCLSHSHFRVVTGTNCHFLLEADGTSVHICDDTTVAMDTIPVFLRADCTYLIGRRTISRAVCSDDYVHPGDDAIHVPDNVRAVVRLFLTSFHDELVKFWSGAGRLSFSEWIARSRTKQPLVVHASGEEYNTQQAADAFGGVMSMVDVPPSFEVITSSIRDSLASRMAETQLTVAFDETPTLNSELAPRAVEWMMQVRSPRVHYSSLDLEFHTPYTVGKSKFQSELITVGLREVSFIPRTYCEAAPNSAGSVGGNNPNDQSDPLTMFSDDEGGGPRESLGWTRRWLLVCIEPGDAEGPYLRLNLMCYERDDMYEGRALRVMERLKRSIASLASHINTELLLADLWRTRVAPEHVLPEKCDEDDTTSNSSRQAPSRSLCPGLPEPTTVRINVYDRLIGRSIFKLFVDDLKIQFEIYNRENCFIVADEERDDSYYIIRLEYADAVDCDERQDSVSSQSTTSLHPSPSSQFPSVRSVTPSSSTTSLGALNPMATSAGRRKHGGVILMHLYAERRSAMTGDFPRSTIQRIHNSQVVQELISALTTRDGHVRRSDVAFLQTDTCPVMYFIPPKWSPVAHFTNILLAKLSLRLTRLYIEGGGDEDDDKTPLFVFPSYRACAGARVQCLLTTAVHIIDVSGAIVEADAIQPCEPTIASGVNGHRDYLNDLGSMSDALPQRSETSHALRISMWTVSKYLQQRSDTFDKFLGVLQAVLRDVSLLMYVDRVACPSDKPTPIESVPDLCRALSHVVATSSEDSMLFSSTSYSVSVTHSALLSTAEEIAGLISDAYVFLQVDNEVRFLDSFSSRMYELTNHTLTSMEIFIVWPSSKTFFSVPGPTKTYPTNRKCFTPRPILEKTIAPHQFVMAKLARSLCELTFVNCNIKNADGQDCTQLLSTRVRQLLQREHDRSLCYNVCIMQSLGLMMPSLEHYNACLGRRADERDVSLRNRHRITVTNTEDWTTANFTQFSAKPRSYADRRLGTFILGCHVAQSDAHFLDDPHYQVKQQQQQQQQQQKPRSNSANSSAGKDSAVVDDINVLLTILHRRGWLEHTDESCSGAVANNSGNNGAHVSSARLQHVLRCAADVLKPGCTFEDFVRNSSGRVVVSDDGVTFTSSTLPSILIEDDCVRHLTQCADTFERNVPLLESSRAHDRIVALWNEGRASSDEYFRLVMASVLNMRLYYCSRSKLHMVQGDVEDVEMSDSDVTAELSSAHRDYANSVLKCYVEYLCQMDPDLHVRIVDGHFAVQSTPSTGIEKMCWERSMQRHGVFVSGERRIAFFPVMVYLTKVTSDGSFLAMELALKGTAIAFDFFVVDTSSTVITQLKSGLHLNSYMYEVHAQYLYECCKGLRKPLPYSPALSAVISRFVSIHPTCPRFASSVIYGQKFTMTLPGETGLIGDSEQVTEAHLIQPRFSGEVMVSSDVSYSTVAIATVDKVNTPKGQLHEGLIYVISCIIRKGQDAGGFHPDLVAAQDFSKDVQALKDKVYHECLRQLQNSITENDNKLRMQQRWRRLVRRLQCYDEASEWIQRLYQIDIRANNPMLLPLRNVPLSLYRTILPRLSLFLPTAGYVCHWIPGPDAATGLFVFAVDSEHVTTASSVLVVQLTGGGVYECVCRCQAKQLPSGTVVDLPPFEPTPSELRLVQAYVHALVHALWVRL